eukprot:5222-Heterococcus_DN1.PRE.1
MYVEALPQPPPLRIVNNRANSGTLSLNVMNRGLHGSINTTATELEQDQKLLATQRKIEVLSATNRHKLQSLAPVKRKKRKNIRTSNRNKASTTTVAANSTADAGITTSRRKSSSGARKQSASTEPSAERRNSSRKNSDVNATSGLTSAKMMTIDTNNDNDGAANAANITDAQQVTPIDMIRGSGANPVGFASGESTANTSSSRRTKSHSSKRGNRLVVNDSNSSSGNSGSSHRKNQQQSANTTGQRLGIGLGADTLMGTIAETSAEDHDRSRTSSSLLPDTADDTMATAKQYKSVRASVTAAMRERLRKVSSSSSSGSSSTQKQQQIAATDDTGSSFMNSIATVSDSPRSLADTASIVQPLSPTLSIASQDDTFDDDQTTTASTTAVVSTSGAADVEASSSSDGSNANNEGSSSSSSSGSSSSSSSSSGSSSSSSSSSGSSSSSSSSSSSDSSSDSISNKDDNNTDDSSVSNSNSNNSGSSQDNDDSGYSGSGGYRSKNRRADKNRNSDVSDDDDDDAYDSNNYYSDDDDDEYNDKNNTLAPRPRRKRYTDNKETFIMELDDETDEDTLSILLDKHPPSGVTFVTASDVPGNIANVANAQMIVAMKRAKWNGLSTGGRLNAALSTLYGELHARLCFK